MLARVRPNLGTKSLANFALNVELMGAATMHQPAVLA